MKINKFIIGIVGVVTATFSIFLPTDPDLGFHLRIGERFWQFHQIPHSNWFNYTFPESHWVPHELISDTIMYLIYHLGGFTLLTIVFSLLMLVIAYLLFFKLKTASSVWVIHVPLVVMTFISLSMSAGVRLQVLSWLGLVLIYFGYLEYREHNKAWPFWLWFIIFLIWANLHNSLIFATVVILIIATLSMIFYGKKQGVYWLKVTLTAALCTFFQPLGYKNHLEFFRTLTDGYKTHIAEWMPSTINHSQGLILILSFTLFFVSLLFISKEQLKKMDFVLLILFIILMFSGFMNIRNVPIAMIALLPIFSQSLGLLIGDFKFFVKNKLLLFVMPIIFFLLFIVFAKSAYDMVIITQDDRKIAIKGGYPYKAVQYLKKNGFPQGNVLNDYGWGGYLIFNFPDQKWFIDGRLPHLKVINPKNTNHKITALEAYLQLTDLRTDPEPLLKYYNIQWTFLQTGSKINYYLKSQGWQELYHDDKAIIYQKS